VRATLAPVYQQCLAHLWAGPYADAQAAAHAEPESDAARGFFRMQRSAQHLADHFAAVPLLLFAFVRRDTGANSIFPAVWSALLAARAEGVGGTLTSILAFRTPEVLEILGVPADGDWTMACCVTFGYPTGRWAVAPRRPAHEVAYRNRWGAAVGFEITEPLWP